MPSETGACQVRSSGATETGHCRHMCSANAAHAGCTYHPPRRTDRPTKLYHLQSDGSVISGFDYRYDNTDNRTSMAQPDGSRTTWSDDNSYQLTAEHRTGSNAFSHTHVYPPRRIGNRLVFAKDAVRTTYSYPPRRTANELVYSLDSSGRTTYTFDPPRRTGNQQIEQKPLCGLTRPAVRKRQPAEGLPHQGQAEVGGVGFEDARAEDAPGGALQRGVFGDDRRGVAASLFDQRSIAAKVGETEPG